MDTPEALRADRGSDSGRRFRPSAIDFGVLAVASLLPVVPAVMDAYGPVYGAVDNYIFSFPLLSYAAEVLRAGELPLWNWRVFAGTHLIGDPQAHILYPLNAVFLLFPSAAVHNAVRFAHYPIAAWLAYLLCRELGMSRVGALVGGVAWATSGSIIMHPAHFSMLPSQAWAPLPLICILKLREGTRAGTVLLGGIGVALSLTGGHAQFLFYWTVMVGGFICIRALWGRDGGIRWVLSAALVYGCGLLLAAAQLVPMLDVLSESHRGLMVPSEQLYGAVRGDDAYALLFPWWNPPNLLRGLKPEMEFHAYPGFMLMGLSLLSLVRARRAAMNALLPWTAAGFLSLLFLFGHPKAVLEWFAEVPPFGWFRGLYRHTFELGMALSMLAAYGAEELIRGRSSNRHLYALSCSLVLGTAGGLYLALASRPTPYPWGFDLNPVLWRLPVYLAGLAGVWLLLGHRRSALAVCCLLSIHVIDQAGFVSNFSHYRYSVRAEGDMVEPLLGDEAAIQKLRETQTRYLSLQVGAFFPLVSNLGALVGVDNATGYNPLIPRGFVSTLPTFTEYGLTIDPRPLARYPHVLDMLAVRYLSVHIRDAEGKYGVYPQFEGRGLLQALSRSEKWQLVLETSHGRLYENNERVSRVWLVRNVRLEAGARSASRDEPESVPEDPRVVAIVEARKQLPGESPGGWFSGEGQVEIVRRTPNSVTYESISDGPVFAVFSEAYSRRWRFEVDGREEPIYRTHGMLVGAALPPGRHRLVLRYDPTMFYRGAAVTALTLVAMSVWVVVESRNGTSRKRCRRSES